MNEANEKVLERVRALLAMAADTSSPNEAAIAAGRARKLMDSHQISLDDLKESNGFGFRNVDKEYRYMPMYRDWLTVAVAKMNDCKAIKTHKYKSSNNSYTYQIVFQGYEADVQLAVHMYDYLVSAIDRLCSVYLQPIMAAMTIPRYPAKLGDAFKKAASHELCTRLRTMQKEREDTLQVKHDPATPGTSLVVFKMAAVEAEFGKAKYVTKSITKRHYGEDVDSARAKGREAGRSINLDRQIDAPADHKRLA